jgi:hypothetical protein
MKAMRKTADKYFRDSQHGEVSTGTEWQQQSCVKKPLTFENFKIGLF